jgi:hypothetical protein
MMMTVKMIWMVQMMSLALVLFYKQPTHYLSACVAKQEAQPKVVY